jgi:hypothetical protein
MISPELNIPACTPVDFTVWGTVSVFTQKIPVPGSTTSTAGLNPVGVIRIFVTMFAAAVVGTRVTILGVVTGVACVVGTVVTTRTGSGVGIVVGMVVAGATGCTDCVQPLIATRAMSSTKKPINHFIVIKW